MHQTLELCYFQYFFWNASKATHHPIPYLIIKFNYTDDQNKIKNEYIYKYEKGDICLII